MLELAIVPKLVAAAVVVVSCIRAVLDVRITLFANEEALFTWKVPPVPLNVTLVPLTVRLSDTVADPTVVNPPTVSDSLVNEAGLN